MITRTLWATLALLAVLVPAAEAAQSPSPVFVSAADHPFGPGDRSMMARIKLQPGETTANIEAWVVYSDNRDAVVQGQVNGPVPHGRARIGAADSTGIVTVQFIFPHTDHKSPNVVDRNAQPYRSGKQLHYKWVKRSGSGQVASEVVTFRLPDKLTVANFGDSYSSGEGAPHATGAKWDSEQCHRSSNSGQAKAVKQYKEAHPETAIAFKNVACSGAGVRDGITGSQKKKGFFEDEDFPTRVKPQYEQVRDWLAENRYEQLNIAIVSIGGNDIGFGPLVKTFFIEPGNIADQQDAGARRARENTHLNITENIPPNYDELKAFFDANFDYDRILVTAYPDPTRDKAGQFCGKPLTLYGVCWGPVEALNNQAEFEFAFTGILTRMNSKIAEKVRAFPRWVFLDGTVAKAQRNGICNCDVPYINTIGASVLEQQDVYGTMHPNRRGHEKTYLPVVRAALDDEIAKIRRQYAKEHAIEIAKEKARRKAEMAAAQRRVGQGQAVTGRSAVERTTALVERNPKISSDILVKARETATKIKPTADVPDVRQPDDHEP